MSTDRLMAELDGAKLVRYDSGASCVYAWFGAHGIHAYDAAGQEFDYWTTGDFAQDGCTEKQAFESMSYRMADVEGLEARAYDLGREHGAAAASWYFDGNTDADTYARVLRGIEEGDPAILDTFPQNPLSGEWADGLTPQSLLAEMGADDSLAEIGAADTVFDSYESGYSDAVSESIERAARYHGPGSAEVCTDCYFAHHYGFAPKSSPTA